ncbi:MAG TPA: hypothetical protein PLH11_10295 [Gemmobacter sp.]|nr:hypothetical protein [Gemmobacter sp.]
MVLAFWGTLDATVKVAIIGGVFLLLGALITGYLQIIAARQNQKTVVQKEDGTEKVVKNIEIDQVIQVLKLHRYTHGSVVFSALDAAMYAMAQIKIIGCGKYNIQYEATLFGTLLSEVANRTKQKVIFENEADFEEGARAIAKNICEILCSMNVLVEYRWGGEMYSDQGFLTTDFGRAVLQRSFLLDLKMRP